MTSAPANHYRPWTARDDARLRAELLHRPAPTVAQRIGRTTGAVRSRAEKIGFSPLQARYADIGMTIAQVSGALGVQRRRVQYWAHQGWLRPESMSAPVWGYTIDAVAAFVAERGALLDLRPDMFWRSIVRECRADLDARLVQRVVLASALGIARETVSYIRRRLDFPAPALSLGAPNGGDYYDRASVRAWLAAHPQYQTTAARELLGGTL